MNLPGNPSASRTVAVILIGVALLGTEFSYHFTLESRFDAIEDKLQQNSLAIQQFQSSIDTISSSKSETLAELNKEVEDLQTSFAPLGKATQEQKDSLAELHQQIATLQQAQSDQLDAQKKLFGSVDQLEKSHLRVRVEPAMTNAAPVASTPAPAPSLVPPAEPISPPTPAPAAATAPAATPHPDPAVSPLRPSVSQSQDATDVRAEDGDGPLPSPGMMAAHETEPPESDTFHAPRALPVGAFLPPAK
jgi:uncharacterized protein YukE